VENFNTTVFNLDKETNGPVEENKVFYKVLIDTTDLENSKNRPTSEIQIKERWTETVRPNRNASRFTLEALAGFDCVAPEDIYPFTPFMPESQHNNRDTDGSIKRGDPYESIETPPADEDHRTQFNLPNLEDYFSNKFILNYFNNEFLHANPRLNRVLIKQKSAHISEMITDDENNEKIHMYEKVCPESDIRIRLEVRYLAYEEVELDQNKICPRHWWNFKVEIENIGENILWLNGQTLNVKNDITGVQMFPNQLESKNIKLRSFIDNIYQFSWLQPLVHDQHEPITAWLRLDGMTLSRTEGDKDKSYDINEKFMVMFPSAEHSMSLHPHDFM